MNKYKKQFEEYLNKYNFNSKLSDAIKYVMFSDGNRIRPQLVLAWCDVCGGNIEDALPLALAIECIHTMSLIHDDLPCMDNETIRRGKFCLHLATNEMTAILTGDTLLSMAFSIVANCDLEDSQKLEAIKVLSKASCSMADGQYIEACTLLHSVDEWQVIHYGKTAVLLESACALGVIAANGSYECMSEAMKYGKSLGMAYQIIDDIRDDDGISIIDEMDYLYNTINSYKNNCDIGDETNSRSFLTSLAKKVLI